LSDREKRVKSVIYDQILPYGENFVKIGPVDPERFILKKEITGCTSVPILNLRVSRPTFTKFTHNVARSSTMNLLKSEWLYSKSFWNAKATNENKLEDFAYFGSKIGCHSNVP